MYFFLFFVLPLAGYHVHSFMMFDSWIYLFAVVFIAVTVFLHPSWAGHSRKRDFNLNEAFTWFNKGYTGFGNDRNRFQNSEYLSGMPAVFQRDENLKNECWCCSVSAVQVLDNTYLLCYTCLLYYIIALRLVAMPQRFRFYSSMCVLQISINMSVENVKSLRSTLDTEHRAMSHKCFLLFRVPHSTNLLN